VSSILSGLGRSSATCALELVRGEMRHKTSESEVEVVDDSVDLDAPLISRQRRLEVDSVFEELPRKDRDPLRMFFLEERDKADLCKRFDVREDYLRVLLHRAKSRFRAMYNKRFSAVNWLRKE